MFKHQRWRSHELRSPTRHGSNHQLKIMRWHLRAVLPQLHWVRRSGANLSHRSNHHQFNFKLSKTTMFPKDKSKSNHSRMVMSGKLVSLNSFLTPRLNKLVGTLLKRNRQIFHVVLMELLRSGTLRFRKKLRQQMLKPPTRIDSTHSNHGRLC